MSAARKKVQLSHQEFFVLASFLKTRHVEFAGKWPRDIAIQCEEAVGRPVTAECIRRAADCAGLVLQKQAERQASPPKRATLIAPVTRGDVICARELIRLIQSLGEKPSELLVKVASGSLL